MLRPYPHPFGRFLNVVLLLADCEVDSLQNVASIISNFHVPRAFRVGGHCFAAPRPPRRTPDRKGHVAHFGVAEEPDVMQRLAVGASRAHPEHDRADGVRERGPGILWRAIHDRARQYGLHAHVTRSGGGSRSWSGSSISATVAAVA